MKKRIALITLLVVLGSSWLISQAFAFHVDAFTFFIPWRAEDLRDFFLADGQQAGTGVFTVTGVEYVISISVLRPDTLIYYDQWEDGMEANLTVPNQPSTQVWGDNNPANGAPPGDPTDAPLAANSVIVLRSEVPLPRPGGFFFDGGDKVVAVGGNIALTVTAWPRPTGEVLFADSFELYPTSRWGTEYVVPIGEDVSRPNAPAFPATSFGFTTVALNVQALDDDVTVTVVDRNGTPITSQVISQGEQFMVNGIESGTRVQASAPVQVHLFAKDPVSTYQARGYSLIPLSQWSADYLAPRSSDGDFWLYNPGATALDVTVQTVTQTTTISIPPRTAGRYLPAPPFSVLSGRSGIRFSASAPFYPVAALDKSQAQDWGYAVLPIGNLSPQALVGWAPAFLAGSPRCDFADPEQVRASRIYVTALEATSLTVRYAPGRTATFNLAPLQEFFITDPVDNDMTGAFLFTDGVPFVAVWGQDADAPAAGCSIDVGSDVVPLRSPSIQKVYTLVEEGFNCGTLRRPNRVQFRLTAYNDGTTTLSEAAVTDNLPSGIVYVPGTTTVRGTSIADDASGSPFPLDGDGLVVGDIEPGGSVVITYDATIERPGQFPNQGILNGADPAIVEVVAPFRSASYQVTKTLVDPPNGLVQPGQTVSFQVVITNTGDVAITELPLRDQFDANLLTFLNASPLMPDLTGTGVVTWTDLTVALGDLQPETSFSLTLNFRVADNVPTQVTSIINAARADGAQGSDGVRQAIVCSEARVNLRAPTPTPTPTPTRRPTPERDRGPTPTPTSPPPPPPAVSVPPPTPAVMFLPETGVRVAGSGPGLWPWIVVPGLGLLLGWAVYRRRDKK